MECAEGANRCGQVRLGAGVSEEVQIEPEFISPGTTRAMGDHCAWLVEKAEKRKPPPPNLIIVRFFSF